MESGKIYQSLGEVMKKIAPIDKTKKNEQQGFMFRSIDDFMNTLHGKFADAGIVIIPEELEQMQQAYDSVNSKGEKKIQFRSKIHMKFTFVSTEDGSSISADGWGEAADNGDKGFNKCKAIALKYILAQMFLVPTKDTPDPDKENPDAVTSKLTSEEQEQLELAKQEIKEAKSLEELNDVAERWKGFYKVKEFVEAGQKRRVELTMKK